jgi:hypothetical protein
MKETYDSLLYTGQLWDICPELKGNWEDDMIDFIEYLVTKYSKYHLNQNLQN